MGFLNPSEDDDYRISQMAGTSEVPAVGAFQGLLTAVPKGLTTAGMKLGSLAGDVLDGTPMADSYRQFRSLTDQANNAMAGLGLPEPVPIFDQAMRTKAEAATQVVADWGATGSDPRQTGVVGRVAAGTAEGISIGVAGGAVAGPWGAASLLGGTEGHSTYLEAKQNGLDNKTAMEQATIVGGFSAASAFLPMKFGNSLTQSVIGGGAMNVGFGMAQRLASSSVLKANGYGHMADQYRVFDGEAMAADAILGAAFGGMGHAMGAHERVNPADVDAASAVAAEEHYNRSAPGVPTDPEVASIHNETMADSLTRMANGDMPDIAPETAQKLVDGVLPDPVHSWEYIPKELAPVEEAAQSKASHIADALRQFAPDKPMYDMSNTEVLARDDINKSANKALENAILGEDADAWRSAMRARDSNNPTRSDAGQKTIDEIEAKLDPKDIEALYGYESSGLPSWLFEDTQPFKEAHTDALMVDTPDHAAQAMSRFLGQLGRTKGDPSTWKPAQQAAYAGMRELRARIGKEGWDSSAIQKAALHRAAAKYGDAVDAEFMLDRFLRPRESVVPEQKTLPTRNALQDVALKELPGYAEAAADVPRQELPPESIPPPKPEPAPAPAGEPTKVPDVPLDDYHQSVIDHLVHNSPDEKFITDDGREVSYRELADEMQAQRNEADKFGVLHEVAAACAARNGF